MIAPRRSRRPGRRCLLRTIDWLSVLCRPQIATGERLLSHSSWQSDLATWLVPARASHQLPRYEWAGGRWGASSMEVFTRDAVLADALDIDGAPKLVVPGA